VTPFYQQALFPFLYDNFDCTVRDNCTLMLGEYVNWEAIENYLPVNYSKASMYLK
jgi:hypothetical protein